MRVIIKSGRHRLRLRLPLSFVKTRFVAKAIAENIAERTNSDVVLTKAMTKKIYRILKDQIKRHGHFNIVEIHSSDGDQVIVRI